jgi:hypothetical protein
VIFINAYAYDDKDFQVWNTEVEEFKIDKNSKIALEEEFRYGDNASEFYYQHYDTQYLYDLNPSLSLGLGYRQVYEKKVAHGKFKQENRPHLNAIIKWSLLGLKFDDRNRLEYRHFGYQSDLWRYRNKITAKFPWKFTRLEIQPYLSDEFFLSFLGPALSRNRSYFGLLMSFTKNLKGELYYLLQSDKSHAKWKATNVLGAKIKLIF